MKNHLEIFFIWRSGKIESRGELLSEYWILPLRNGGHLEALRKISLHGGAKK
jgi:hypothetical protein